MARHSMDNSFQVFCYMTNHTGVLALTLALASSSLGSWAANPQWCREPERTYQTPSCTEGHLVVRPK